MFDEEPERDPHGECAQEIHRLQKERDEARALANEQFSQIQRELSEGIAHNEAGRKENAKLRAEVGFQESLYRDASAARDKHWKALQDALLQVDAMRPVVEAAKEVYSVRSEAVVWSQQGVNKSFEKYKVRHQEAGEKLDAAVKTFIEKRKEPR